MKQKIPINKYDETILMLKVALSIYKDYNY